MNGYGSLKIDGSQKTVTVTVDGVVSNLSVVEHDGSLHLFSSVRYSHHYFLTFCHVLLNGITRVFYEINEKYDFFLGRTL